MEEELPVSEKLKVLKSFTLYKTGKWWSAIVLIDSFGRKQVALYVWLNKNGKWKRNQKFIIHSRLEWFKIKETVENFVSQL
jgi:hypothetical protein